MELIPTLPPTLESWASIVVGTCMKSTPLNKDEARNPVKSPVAPPPIATKQVLGALAFVDNVQTTSSSHQLELLSYICVLIQVMA